MRVMVIIKASADSEAGKMPSEKLLGDMMKFNEELVNAGVMKAGEGLHPSSRGKRVVFSGDKRTVVDGPFAETKELIAGFWLWDVKSMDDAVAWVKRMPCDESQPDSAVELRQVFEVADFGAAATPEIRALEADLRGRTQNGQA